DLVHRFFGSGFLLREARRSVVISADNEEKHKADDQEVDYRIDKQTDAERDFGIVSFSGAQHDPHFAEVNAAGYQADDRADNVSHQRIDDGGKRGADDDTDRKIQNIAPHDEVSKLGQHGLRSLKGNTLRYLEVYDSFAWRASCVDKRTKGCL